MNYSDEQQVMARAAWMYYKEGLTQQEIGDRLNLSRVTINRLLQRARKRGVVQFHIDTSGVENLELESALRQRFELHDALVTLAVEPEATEARYAALARTTADWLTAHLKEGMRVGLGTGRTISRLPDYFAPPTPIDCAFAEVVGGAAAHSGEMMAYNVTSKMAELAGGRAEYIYAPMLASNPASHDSIVQEPAVAQALERARHSDILIQSVGPVDETALLYLHGHLSDEDLRFLQERGAVGDMLGHYFDAQGKPVLNPISERIIGLSLEDIARIPLSLVMAGGPEKVPVLLAALRGRLFNVLITDAWTAQQILHEK
ncbi:MAG: sugar-binding transcriptional regulator [Anaerolineae bacterium]